MGAIDKVLVFFAITTAVSAAVLYTWMQSMKVPDGFIEPGKLRMAFAMIKTFGAVNGIITFFTGEGVPMDSLVITDLPPSVTKEEKYIEGIRTVIYRPVGESKIRPAIVYYHGGGWILGRPEIDEAYHSDLIDDFGVVVISIDYRLAPKHPFPIPFDDCYKVTKYILANTKEFNIDPKRIVISGASAGGNLAAAVGTKLRDEGLAKKIRGQLLIVPVLQAHDFETTSYQENRYDSLVSQEGMIAAWVQYALGENDNDAVQSLVANTHVPQEKRDDFVKLCGNSPHLTKTVNKPTDKKLWKQLQPYFENPYMAPLVAKDLSGIAPTIVVTAGQDVLRDDGLIYAERLKRSGVQVSSVHIASAFHGSFAMKNFVPLDYDRAYKEVMPHLKKLLE